MPALRTLGMVILAIFVVSLGILGYRYMRFMISEREAREAALKLDASVSSVVTAGGSRTENISIPDGYTMRFVDNQIVIDGFRVPVHGYSMRFADDCPELGAGNYCLSITIVGSSENWRIKIG